MISLTVLGEINASQTKGLDYHECYRVSGFKAYERNGTLSFVSFSDTPFRIELVQEGVFVKRPAEDEVDLLDIKGAKGKRMESNLTLSFTYWTLLNRKL